MMKPFRIQSDYKPNGDQPQAIKALTESVIAGTRDQVLLGVTGSGKTFTIANVVQALNRPTLVLAHNKTLAAQLYQEFSRLFPDNAVEYFVSYYDYYQPEAYVPRSDTYIEKESTVNEEIDRMRHSATRSLFERRDVLIVASVSCIYGLGSPEAYHGMMLLLEKGAELDRDRMLRKLVEIQYTRTPADLRRGSFRVRGDTVEIWPAYSNDAVRLEFWGEELESISKIDPVRGVAVESLDRHPVYPNTHFVMPQETRDRALVTIREELDQRLAELDRSGRILESRRLHQRALFDLEMLQEVGYCHGIENYSRHMTGRLPGEPPPTLLDYFPDDTLLIVDESHVSVPQVRAMFKGDRSRKQTLVDHGFRLPSALDNRPLTFEEFDARRGQAIYISATPAPYELTLAGGEIVEQVVRPTGLLDPLPDVRPVAGQVDDLLAEIRLAVKRDERVLVTTLTKRMAEDLTEYYREVGVRVEYLHSDVVTLERIRILRDLRAGNFDVLIGVNLLREGLDLPEVSLVAILDADKEGFLRSQTSLIQTIGRAARHVSGKAILYADRVTGSMKRAIDETMRRRQLQEDYNREHGITPETIRRALDELMGTPLAADYSTVPIEEEDEEAIFEDLDALEKEVSSLETAMRKAAGELDFETAAHHRDRIRFLREKAILA
ncbi:MAG: excinuclease ABC subunit UvrB [Acidobacteria bacterium]|uniref:UvrABC system protein B n=1 Tax=Candidatus Polarisedimenticola svalbardensis TaxID=2886004 RepID=A0A8J6XTQ5_9BACT|nr:excinuclease ABC subunit UvrB [Candidatus Polarisedimenticola svalbardensis]